jgi:RecJ-like exonuclease
MRTPEMQKAIDAVSERPCECEQCPVCKGSGHVWFDIGGHYLGRNRCDDLDTMGTCDECYGRGMIEYCDRCSELEELDIMEQEEEERQLRIEGQS